MKYSKLLNGGVGDSRSRREKLDIKRKMGRVFIIPLRLYYRLGGGRIRAKYTQANGSEYSCKRGVSLQGINISSVEVDFHRN